jgi:hypothetical protein
MKAFKKFLLMLAAVLLASGMTARAEVNHWGTLAQSIHTATDRCAPLFNTVSSNLFELDATCASSYGGSGQTWANLNPTPADGSGQTAYDFYRGSTSSATGDDPTFNGSAGDAAAYWSVNGSQFFQIAAGNTNAIKNIGKTTGGQPVTLVIAMRAPPDFSGGNSPLWGNVASSAGWGFINTILSSGTIYNYNITTSAHNHSLSSTGALLVSTDYLIFITIDYTGGTTSYAVNANSLTSGTLPTATSTTNPDGVFQIASDGGAGSTISRDLLNGTRIYGVYVFNAVLSNGNVASIVSLLNTRHARTYAVLGMRPGTMFAANDSGAVQ